MDFSKISNFFLNIFKKNNNKIYIKNISSFKNVCSPNNYVLPLYERIFVKNVYDFFSGEKINLDESKLKEWEKSKKKYFLGVPGCRMISTIIYGEPIFCSNKFFLGDGLYVYNSMYSALTQGDFLIVGELDIPCQISTRPFTEEICDFHKEEICLNPYDHFNCQYIIETSKEISSFDKFITTGFDIENNIHFLDILRWVKENDNFMGMLSEKTLNSEFLFFKSFELNEMLNFMRNTINMKTNLNDFSSDYSNLIKPFVLIFEIYQDRFYLIPISKKEVLPIMKEVYIKIKYVICRQENVKNCEKYPKYIF